MSQAFECQLWLYTDDNCLIFQHKDIIKTETVLNKNSSMLYDWFVISKFSVHFCKDETKSVLFCSKHKIKYSKPLNILYNDIKTKRLTTKILTSHI